MKQIIVPLLILISIYLVNCKPTEIEPKDTSLGVLCDSARIEFTSEKDAKLLVINSATDWEVSADSSWLSFTATKGKGKTAILVGAVPNYALPRIGKITVKSAAKQVVIVVSQAGVEALNFEIEGVKFNMKLAVAGKFMMGATGNSNNSPLRQVKVDSFYICEIEVANALWNAVTGSLPYDTVGAIQNKQVSKLMNEPVTCVSWKDITTVFLTKLHQKTGLNFRLPTEAEWEYAASGAQFGNKLYYAGSNNIDEVAWFYDNSGRKKQAVKQLLPNELGLYDMSGNVSEWCSDWYKEFYGEWYGSTPDYYITVMNPKGPDVGT
ncbi:SUMF1/EgtB/PvdO family nonheme iron enzyme, partial [bacterium]|nr:SUMF1/EgtB/PvdO family nonheme iron enzyme [bacterium]